jgi:tetratricopeptide (TPR) repeat protein
MRILRATLSSKDSALGSALIYEGLKHLIFKEYLLAEQCFKESLNIFKKCKNIDPYYFSKAYDGLGKYYLATGDSESAEDYLNKSLMIRTKIYGRKHWSSAKCISLLGDLRVEQNRISEARKYYHEALDIFRQQQFDKLATEIEDKIVKINT